MSSTSKYERRQYNDDDNDDEYETEFNRYDKYDSKRDDVPNDDDKDEPLQIITEVAVPHYSHNKVDAGEEQVVDNDNVEEVEEDRDDDEQEEEYPAHNNAYRHRKALLEQVLSEYDQQHQLEKKMYKNKITTLKREKEAQKIQSLNEINKLNDTITNKFETLETQIEEALEQEREERNASYREIEEHFVMRDNEVEGLLKIIAMQGDELAQAKNEREELRTEIQNMMMSFHTKFERFEEKGFKTNAELTMLREESMVNKKLYTDEISKIKQCLCMIQENVDNERKETHDLIATITTKITSSQKESQLQLNKVLNDQQTIVSSYLNRNNDKFEKINTDIKNIRTELENVHLGQGKIEGRQNDSNDRMKSNESTILECRHMITELNDYVRKEAAVTIEELVMEKDEVKVHLESLNGTIKQIKDHTTELNNKLNNDKLDVEYMDVKFKDSIMSLEQKMQEQEALLSLDIDNLGQNLKTVVECMGTKLSDIRADIQTFQATQNDVNLDFKQQHQNLHKHLQEMHHDMERKLQDEIKNFEKLYDELRNIVATAQTKRGVDLEAYEIMVHSWHVKFDGITKIIQQRSEAQSLASRDFKTTQNDFEERMKLCTAQLNTLERRVTHTESSLCSTVTSDLVDIMIQPYIKQNDSISELMKKQTDEVKSLKDQIKSAHIDRNSVTDKIENMNKTWEALFQHLAGQLQKEMVDMHKMKKETDIVLKDVKRLSVSLETKMSSITKSEDSSKQVMNMVKSIQEDIQSCDTRITNSIRDMKRQQASYEKMFLAHRLENKPAFSEGETDYKPENVQAGTETDN